MPPRHGPKPISGIAPGSTRYQRDTLLFELYRRFGACCRIRTCALALRKPRSTIKLSRPSQIPESNRDSLLTGEASYPLDQSGIFGPDFIGSGPVQGKGAGRSDAPRYPIWGFDRIYSFRSERRKGLNTRPSYKKVCRKD